MTAIKEQITEAQTNWDVAAVARLIEEYIVLPENFEGEGDHRAAKPDIVQFVEETYDWLYRYTNTPPTLLLGHTKTARLENLPAIRQMLQPTLAKYEHQRTTFEETVSALWNEAQCDSKTTGTVVFRQVLKEAEKHPALNEAIQVVLDVISHCEEELLPEAAETLLAIADKHLHWPFIYEQLDKESLLCLIRDGSSLTHTTSREYSGRIFRITLLLAQGDKDLDRAACEIEKILKKCTVEPTSKDKTEAASKNETEPTSEDKEKLNLEEWIGPELVAEAREFLRVHRDPTLPLEEEEEAEFSPQLTWG